MFRPETVAIDEAKIILTIPMPQISQSGETNPGPEIQPLSTAAVQRTSDSLCAAYRSIFTEQPSNPSNRPDPSKFPSADLPYLVSGVHHPIAETCQKAVQDGCPICYTVWTRAIKHGERTSTVWKASKEKDFTTWSLSRNGSDLYAQESWPEDRLVLSISVGSVSYAEGRGPVYVFANDQVAFSFEPISGQGDSAHDDLIHKLITSQSTLICYLAAAPRRLRRHQTNVGRISGTGSVAAIKTADA